MYEHYVAGQEKPHMCVWPLNMYLLQNIQEELSEISFIQCSRYPTLLTEITKCV